MFNKASALKWYNDAGEAYDDSAVYSDHKLILFLGLQFPTSVPYIEGYIIRY